MSDSPNPEYTTIGAAHDVSITFVKPDKYDQNASIILRRGDRELYLSDTYNSIRDMFERLVVLEVGAAIGGFAYHVKCPAEPVPVDARAVIIRESGRTVVELRPASVKVYEYAASRTVALLVQWQHAGEPWGWTFYFDPMSCDRAPLRRVADQLIRSVREKFNEDGSPKVASAQEASSDV